MKRSVKSKEYFDNTENYLGSNPIITLRKTIIRDLIGEQKNKQILDVGCGNGELTSDFIFNNHITFLDISQKMLDLTKKNISNDNLINTEFENIDISLFKPDRKFDLVICVGVLAHVDSVSDLISKLNEITSENGRIILQFTANEKLLSRINLIRYKYFSRDQYKYDVNKVSSSKMDSLLNSAGLKIIKKISYSPVSTFFSFFNYQKKIQLLELSYKNHFLSYFGSESILLLSKS